MNRIDWMDALAHAAATNNSPAAEGLLRRIPSIEDPDLFPAMQAACERGHVDMLGKLLRQPLAYPYGGKSITEWAARRGRRDCLETTLHHSNRHVRCDNEANTEPMRNNAFAFAAAEGHLDIVRWFLSQHRATFRVLVDASFDLGHGAAAAAE